MAESEGGCWYSGMDREPAEKASLTLEFSNDYPPCDAPAPWHVVLSNGRPVLLCDKHLALLVTEAPRVLLEVSARER